MLCPQPLDWRAHKRAHDRYGNLTYFLRNQPITQFYQAYSVSVYRAVYEGANKEGRSSERSDPVGWESRDAEIAGFDLGDGELVQNA